MFSFREKAKERELVELFEVAKKAAEAAAASSSVSDGADENRCLDALEQLKKFPVTYQILVSTQVGKSLRHLTKHPRTKIQAFASNLMEMWKDIVIKESNKKKQAGNQDREDSEKLKPSPCSESGNPEKLRKSSSLKVEKLVKNEDVQVERVHQNGMLNCVKISKTESATSETKVLDMGAVQSVKSDSIEKVKFEKIIKEDRKSSDTMKPLLNHGASPKLTSMVKSNDAMRDKIRELLYEAFSKVPGEADENYADELNACDPMRVAVSVESMMFEKWGGSAGAQKAKYRSVMFNIKDQKNPDFRRKVLLGHIKPEILVDMNTAEMASDERQRENQEIQQKALFDCERAGAPKATTDQFKCGRCGQRMCTYYQMQTRSADEPMTTYVTCVNCNNHWKFC